MTTEAYIAFLAANALLVYTPGPTMLLVVHYALTYGRQVGKYTIPAVLLGDIIAVNFSLYILGSLLNIFPSSFVLLKIVGGVYMILLGVSNILSQKKIVPDEKNNIKLPDKKVFVHVMLITAFNPKTLIFLLAFLPQFLNPNGNILSQTLLMGVSSVLLGLTGSSFYTMAASKIHHLVNTPRAQKIVHFVSGSILCAIGISTILL
ncbi:LysE family translocator [Candidatus Megaera venefica]|uniref:LysE family translocator n=2 Tax=Candidatus Megaera venefica TaxID=2055910 RepID=A0ABU5NB50_9RICK|nr:LysE family translocator [Candidatus Megaera venefica]